MREILFRGKRLDNGKWTEDFLICPLFDKSRAYIGTLFPIDDHDIDMLEVDPETVGQYTGLTDKNGKKIFEGDIVNTYHLREFLNCSYVEYEEGCFWLEKIYGSKIDLIETLFDYK